MSTTVYGSSPARGDRPSTVLRVGRRIDADHLVGASEIAKRLGMRRPQVVHVWRQRHPDFPQPVARLDLGMIWYWPDVERWARRTGRL